MGTNDDLIKPGALISIQFEGYVFGYNKTAGEDFAVLTTSDGERYYAVRGIGAIWEVTGKFFGEEIGDLAPHMRMVLHAPELEQAFQDAQSERPPNVPGADF